MTGGLIELVSKNFQDLYLTHNPEITFFKMIYRRHTNFSQELIPLLFNTEVDFGQKISCKISNNGDLLNKVYLHLELPSIPIVFDNLTGNEDSITKYAWVKKVGYALIKNVEIEIGGRVIDKQYGEWLNIWYELIDSTKTNSLDKLIGNVDELNSFTNGKDSYQLFIPLKFWFCNNIGLSAVLI